MAGYNVILALLDDGDIIDMNRNIIAHAIEDLQEPLPHDYNVRRRGIREKNRNYYEEIIPAYNNYVFKEHFRMSARTIEVYKFIC